MRRSYVVATKVNMKTCSAASGSVRWRTRFSDSTIRAQSSHSFPYRVSNALNDGPIGCSRRIVPTTRSAAVRVCREVRPEFQHLANAPRRLWRDLNSMGPK
jgi:hypothetical protein